MTVTLSVRSFDHTLHDPLHFPLQLLKIYAGGFHLCSSPQELSRYSFVCVSQVSRVDAK